MQASADEAGRSRVVDHKPLDRAASPWRLCAVLPHVKDEYWLSVLYGMVEEARRLGVSLAASETQGYRSVAQQAARLRACPGDAAILGAVSYSGEQLDTAIAETAQRMPVVAAVNDVASSNIAVRVGVSWAEMGAQLGAHMARVSACPAKALFATGPAEAGWAPIHAAGFKGALADSCIKIVDEAGADTNTREQLDIVERLLDRNPDARLFAADAPGAEALLFLLRTRGEIGRMKVFATYYTPAIRRGLTRGLIEAAPFDDPLLQGRLAVEYAVRAIEGRLDWRRIGPVIKLATKDSLPAADALAPADFRPSFSVR